MVKSAKKNNGTSEALPLTLLSGFLGSGKTTLLQRILNNKTGIKVAVIVNDLAAVNVDANIVSKDIRGDDTLVHLENGCICCDLNEEFVKQVVSLYRLGGFDYILVENTGVADPEPVAESLVNQGIGLAGSKEKLTDMVKLDTCVTVVDASMFFEHMYDGKRLKESTLGENGKSPEVEGLICSLMASQIEYSDVVALNKVDLLEPGELDNVKRAVQALNPKSRVFPCEYGEIDLKELLGTGRYSKTTTAANPLVSGQAPRDTNFEDAVTSFVYKSRMPFHPTRLFDFLTRHFDLHERDWSAKLNADQEAASATIQAAGKAIEAFAKLLPRGQDRLRSAADLAVKSASIVIAEAEACAARRKDAKNVAKNEQNAEKVVDRRSAKEPASKSKVFGRLLRSKGLIWLAGTERYEHLGDWSSVGDVLQLTTGGGWAARLPERYWPDDPKQRAAMFEDMLPGIGDRRQELVFIGMGLKEKELRAELDKCLCTTSECCKGVEDPFAEWPSIDSLLPEAQYVKADLLARLIGGAMQVREE